MQNFTPRQTKRRAGPKKPARRCFYAVSGTVFLVGGQAERCTAAQGQRKQQRDVHAVAGLGDGHRGLRRRHHQGRRVVLAAARSHDDLLQFWRTRRLRQPRPSRYGHMTQTAVTAGKAVTAGQVMKMKDACSQSFVGALPIRYPLRACLCYRLNR